MAKKKQKYYVVWQGNEPGIYNSWAECQLQIKGYPNAKYKSFGSKAAAEEAYGGNAFDYFAKNKKPAKAFISEEARAAIVWDSWAVDAACSGNPGDMEYRGVDTQTGNELFRVGPLKMGTNNVGEFLAIVHALALLQREGKGEHPIYTDSKIAMAWVRRREVKTKLVRSRHNAPLFDLISRGLKWLKQNTYKNPIMKWETKSWGEIPADFGRK